MYSVLKNALYIALFHLLIIHIYQSQPNSELRFHLIGSLKTGQPFVGAVLTAGINILHCGNKM